MAVMSAAHPDASTRLVAHMAEHVVLIWQDPGFQTVLRREAKRFALTVASEARAASLRNRNCGAAL